MKTEPFPEVPRSSRISSRRSWSSAAVISGEAARPVGVDELLRADATATSTSPAATASHAWCTAVEPEAQAFSTLTSGNPISPVPRTACWPRTDSWPWTTPAPLLP